MFEFVPQHCLPLLDTKIFQTEKVRFYYGYVEQDNDHLRYHLKTNPRAFQAILNGHKLVEMRVASPGNTIDFGQMRQGDEVVFYDESSGNIARREIEKVTHYRSVLELLEAEGVERTLSSGTDISVGVNNMEKFYGKELLDENGVYAIIFHNFDGQGD